MHEFKVGDSVKLKYGLIVDNVYGTNSYVEEMAFDGYRTITQTNAVFPRIVIDGISGYEYTPEMMELKPKPEIKYVPFRHKFSKINHRNQ